MPVALTNQVISLVVTILALAIALGVFADIAISGIYTAVPRDAVTLAVFALVRWFIGRTVPALTFRTITTEES